VIHRFRRMPVHPSPGAKEAAQMLSRPAESLNTISNTFDELVEKYAPGSREFDHWIAESAELSSRLDIHKAYCLFCREE
jgi:hypothetical protein